MNDITPEEAIEILGHYTDLGYGIIIEGDNVSRIKQALSLAREMLANDTPYNPTVEMLPICGAQDEAICEEMTADGHCSYTEYCPNKESIRPNEQRGYEVGSVQGMQDRPQGGCCGSCYLCDVRNCSAEMRKGDE